MKCETLTTVIMKYEALTTVIMENNLV